MWESSCRYNVLAAPWLTVSQGHKEFISQITKNELFTKVMWCPNISPWTRLFHNHSCPCLGQLFPLLSWRPQWKHHKPGQPRTCYFKWRFLLSLENNAAQQTSLRGPRQQPFVSLHQESWRQAGHQATFQVLQIPSFLLLTEYHLYLRDFGYLAHNLHKYQPFTHWNLPIPISQNSVRSYYEFSRSGSPLL